LPLKAYGLELNSLWVGKPGAGNDPSAGQQLNGKLPAELYDPLYDPGSGS
jgi:hypothetical protein